MAVTHRTIVMAINEPGGIVYEWRDERAKEMRDRARLMSPRNHRANAKHRGGVTGTYRRAWRWERGRSSDVVLRAVVRNRANHAVFVEVGRSLSYEYQRFSWTKWDGQIRYIGKPPKHLFADLPKSRTKRTKMIQERLRAWERAARRGQDVGTPWGGRKTRARAGKNVLVNAINYVMVPWGFTRLPHATRTG